MNLFENQQPQKPIMQQLQDLKANPVSFLKNMGYNIPDNLAQNPMGIMQHLAQSGQFNQQQMQRYQQAMRTPARR